MNAKPTPGPWEFSLHNKGKEINNPNTWTVVQHSFEKNLELVQ